MSVPTTAPINVYTESSPNPNSLKFVFDFFLLKDASIDFPTKEDAEAAPLAYSLFDSFPWVKRVFIASNFVTLTKDEGTDWFEASPKVRDFLKVYIEEQRPVFTDAIEAQIKEQQKPVAAAPSGNVSDSEIAARVQTVLEEYVKPAVEQDGGAISLASYADGVVKVHMQGACSGCPSSTMTLKAGIENLLKRMVPEVKEVVAEGV